MELISENTKRLIGQYWYLEYTCDASPKYIYDELKKMRSSLESPEPLILIGERGDFFDGNKEVHCIVDARRHVDWLNRENKFKYNGIKPKIYRIHKWRDCMLEFKSKFNDIYPLNQKYPFNSNIPSTICSKCNETKTLDNFLRKKLPDVCEDCFIYVTKEESQKLDDLSLEERVFKLEKMVNTLYQENIMHKKDIIILRKDINRQTMLSFNFIELIKSKFPEDKIEEILEEVQKEDFIYDENIGCVIISFGSADKNCISGSVFVPDVKNTVEEYALKNVVYVGFTDNIAREIESYSILKEIFGNVIEFKVDKINIPKQLLSYSKEKFKEFVKVNSQQIKHVDILGYPALKDENVLLVDKKFHPVIKSFIKNFV